MLARRSLIAAFPALALAPAARSDAWVGRLTTAAGRQIGRTRTYDPAYVRLDYPGGDVPADRGVCTDVIIRAYREGLGVDLQKLVHEDMSRAFAAYPRTWGLARPDRNIDHRRVPNLETFLARRGAALPPGTPVRPGDLVTQRLPGNLPHILLMDSAMAAPGRPMAIHNVGAGTQREDVLNAWTRVGHFRWAGPTA